MANRPAMRAVDLPAAATSLGPGAPTPLPAGGDPPAISSQAARRPKAEREIKRLRMGEDPFGKGRPKARFPFS